MTRQAVVERGMLDGLAGGVAQAKYAIEARIGEGNAKWLLAAMVIAVLFWAMRSRR